MTFQHENILSTQDSEVVHTAVEATVDMEEDMEEALTEVDSAEGDSVEAHRMVLIFKTPIVFRLF